MSPAQVPSQNPLRGAAGSWLALLAATTLGDAAGTVRAEVRADGLPADGRMYRLVIESYDTGRRQRRPPAATRPVGSMQRSVTADELRHGIHVNLLEIRDGMSSGGSSNRAPPIATRPGRSWWPGSTRAVPISEFDGRQARPGAGSVYGLVRRDTRKDVVQINLNQAIA